MPMMPRTHKKAQAIVSKLLGNPYKRSRVIRSKKEKILLEQQTYRSR